LLPDKPSLGREREREHFKKREKTNESKVLFLNLKKQNKIKAATQIITKKTKKEGTALSHEHAFRDAVAIIHHRVSHFVEHW